MRRTTLTNEHGTSSIVIVRTLILFGASAIAWLEPVHLPAEALEPYSRVQVEANDNVVGFSADGTYLFITDLQTMRRYDLNEGHYDEPLALPCEVSAVSASGKEFACIDSTEVKLFDFESGDLRKSFGLPIQNGSSDLRYEAAFGDEHDLYVRWATFSPYSARNYVLDMLFGTWTTCTATFHRPIDCDTAALFQDRIAEVRATSNDDLADYRDLSFAQDGSKLLMIETIGATMDEPMYLVHVLNLKDPNLTPVVEPSSISLARSPGQKDYELESMWFADRPMVLYVKPSSGVFILDVYDRSVTGPLSFPFFPVDVVLSGDNRWIALSSEYSPSVWVYALGETRTAPRNSDPTLPRLVPQLGTSGSIVDLALSDDGRIAVIAGYDDLALWNVDTGREFRHLPSSGGRIGLLDDGSQLLTAPSIDHLHPGAVWDTASGEVRLHIEPLTHGFGDIQAGLFDGGDRALLCSEFACVQTYLPDPYSELDDWLFTELPDGVVAGSLASDRSAIALALGAGGIGWIELNTDGLRKITPVTQDVAVTAVASLDGGRVVAGLSNGDLWVVDAVRGDTLALVSTRDTEIGDIVRLDETRIAVASQGRYVRGQPSQGRDWEILIVDVNDFSIVQRLTLDRTIADSYDVSVATRLWINGLAAGRDGRWLAAALANSKGTKPIVQLWDTTTGRASAVLGSRALPINRVEFDADNSLLLVDSDWDATLWNLRDGHVTGQFRHQFSVAGAKLATLSHDKVFYITSLGVHMWSIRSGVRTAEFGERRGDGFGFATAIDADRARIGYTYFPDYLVLQSVDEFGEQSQLIERKDLVASIDDEFFPRNHVRLYSEEDLVLQNWGTKGIEAIRMSDAKSIWWRKDILSNPDHHRNGTDLMLTKDKSDVVIMAGYIDSSRVMVLDADTGATRFVVENRLSQPMIPVVTDGVAYALLRLADDFRIERIDLHDGSVIDRTNLGIASISFAVPDPTGKLYLVARATRDLIADLLRMSGEFSEVHTISLIAERDSKGGPIKGSASRADLLAVLDVLAGEDGDNQRLRHIPGAASLAMARPDDLLYLAFSGHGLSRADGVFHLFLSDIGEGDTRVVDKGLLELTVDSDDLADRLRRVDAGDFVIVIDACNAAASVEGSGFKPGPMGSRGLGQLAYDKAMRVLAASQAEGAALESSQLRHGLLTFAMLREGLVSGFANRAPEDGWIELGELLSYGAQRVPLLEEEMRDGTFVGEGKGLAGFTPTIDSDVVAVQQPRLFDFSRTEHDVRVPVLNSGESKD